jgi:hypothetical protein
MEEAVSMECRVVDKNQKVGGNLTGKYKSAYLTIQCPPLPFHENETTGGISPERFIMRIRRSSACGWPRVINAHR